MESFSGSADISESNYSVTEDPEEELDVAWVAGEIENSVAVRTTYGLIAFIGIAGNALVCFVLVRVPSLRTRTSQFIINLAINDLLTCMLVIPFHLFPNYPPAPSGLAGQFYCRLFISKALLWASIVASTCSLLAVTTERYFAVVHPIRYKIYFTTRLTIVVVIACWVFAFLLTSYHMASFEPFNGICIFIPFKSTENQKVFGVFLFIMMYALPIAISLILHVQAIISLRNQAKLLENGHPRREGVVGDRWQLRAANDMQKTLFVVVVVYFVCWGPNHFLFLAFTFGVRVDFASPYYHFTVIIALFNSCVNPLIYVFKNKAFRRGISQAMQLPTQTAAVHPVASGTGSLTGSSGNRQTASTIA